LIESKARKARSARSSEGASKAFQIQGSEDLLTIETNNALRLHKAVMMRLASWFCKKFAGLWGDVSNI